MGWSQIKHRQVTCSAQLKLRRTVYSNYIQHCSCFAYLSVSSCLLIVEGGSYHAITLVAAKK